jgi:hypothetical protein
MSTSIFSQGIALIGRNQSKPEYLSFASNKN